MFQYLSLKIIKLRVYPLKVALIDMLLPELFTLVLKEIPNLSVMPLSEIKHRTEAHKEVTVS